MPGITNRLGTHDEKPRKIPTCGVYNLQGGGGQAGVTHNK